MKNNDEILPDGTLILDQPRPLPEVLDLLIIGGGPAGTAAAFRARELGLSALVVDYDDLMKRIRDYSKEKLILPSFGGGDRMQFPKGGELVSQLVFSDIDKDEMCSRWKGLYRKHGIPAQIGVELTGLEEESEGVWKVLCWNHGASSEQSFRAKHVVLAVGRGVPRRFDLPGNVEGMAFRLADPRQHVGQPACIIGGGTSAAEAVIGVSNAKAQAGDESSVFWSYRGEKMPKVSRALAAVFLEAFAGNGNIRYLPNSEPVSVYAAGDGCEYLCVRIARKQPPGRPIETVHLEFLKQQCIACIGEDLPVGLLNSLGIHWVSGGPKNRQRLAVTPLLETTRPNLYLAGDLLSPAYLESDDLSGDPSGFREIKRRGNVKSALRDGVLVSEVIAQKLEGKTGIHVRLEFAEAPPPQAASPSPAAALAAPNGAEKPSGARLMRIHDDQVVMDEFPLPPDGVTTLGNRGCDISFEQDSSLADRHASISVNPQGCWLKDEGGNGVFLQPAAGRSLELADAAIIRAGSQWLVFGNPSDPRTVVHYDSRGREVQRIQLPQRTIVLGRQAADIVLDPSDPTLSRRHLSVSIQGGRRVIKDLESVNGTHLKVETPTRLEHGDRIWMGRQILEFSSDEDPAPSHEVQLETPEKPAQAAPQVATGASAPAAAAPNGLMVRFENLNRTLPIRKGQTICELAEEHGIRIAAQCHRGICGSDPIRILSGHENLNPMGEGEEETLEDLCSLDDGRHRLACMARPTGPVVLEIIDK